LYTRPVDGVSDRQPDNRVPLQRQDMATQRNDHAHDAMTAQDIAVQPHDDAGQGNDSARPR